jgi:hypothetical protein
VTTATSLACPWCEKRFKPQRCGSPQVFCTAACRSAFHSASRRWAERALACGLLTIAELQNSDPQACTLRERMEEGSSLPETRSGNSASHDAPARFVVEVPPSIIHALIFSFRYLRFDQRDDLLAILAALDRVGRRPSIARIH